MSWSWSCHCPATGPGASPFPLSLISLLENQRVGQMARFPDTSADSPMVLRGCQVLSASVRAGPTFHPNSAVLLCSVIQVCGDKGLPEGHLQGFQLTLFFLFPKRCHWSDMFTGRLRCEIPPALVSEWGLCSCRWLQGPLWHFPGLFLTASSFRRLSALWVPEMLKWQPGEHSLRLCPDEQEPGSEDSESL